MIYEYAYLYIIPDREEEFEKALLDAAPILRSAAGCLSVDLHRDVETQGSYLLRVGWATLEDHLETFPASEQAPRFAAAIEHFFAREPTLRHFAAHPCETSDQIRRESAAIPRTPPASATQPADRLPSFAQTVPSTSTAGSAAHPPTLP